MIFFLMFNQIASENVTTVAQRRIIRSHVSSSATSAAMSAFVFHPVHMDTSTYVLATTIGRPSWADPSVLDHIYIYTNNQAQPLKSLLNLIGD